MPGIKPILLGLPAQGRPRAILLDILTGMETRMIAMLHRVTPSNVNAIRNRWILAEYNKIAPRGSK